MLSPALQGCATGPEEAFPWSVGGFSPRRGGGEGGHSAVLSVSVSMASTRWLCSSLPAGSAGSSGGGGASGSGILGLESAQKGNREFKGKRRESKDQRGLFEQSGAPRG